MASSASLKHNKQQDIIIKGAIQVHQRQVVIVLVIDNTLLRPIYYGPFLLSTDKSGSYVITAIANQMIDDKLQIGHERMPDLVNFQDPN